MEQETSPIIIAERIEENKFIIENEDFKVNIILVINSSNERFMKEININDMYWSSNKKYFQDNFVLFVKTLTDTLIKKSGNLTFKIERLDNDNINIKLKHSSSFLSFTTEFILVKILTENEKISFDIDKLIKENNKLKFELQNLKREIINIKSNYNRINESYTLIELKNVLIGGNLSDYKFYYEEKHYKPSNENYSGEIILLNHIDELKNRMNTNSYVACMRFDNGKTFYFKYPWRQILLNLNPILPYYYFKQYNIEAKQRLETTYIRIPKDDIKNIGIGLGQPYSLPSDEGRYYHGFKYNESSNRYMIKIYGKYQELWEYIKDLENPKSSKYKIEIPESFNKLFEITSGSQDATRKANIIMPIEYYCTNCIKKTEYFPNGKSVDDNGWEIYECLGHE